MGKKRTALILSALMLTGCGGVEQSVSEQSETITAMEEKTETAAVETGTTSTAETKAATTTKKVTTTKATTTTETATTEAETTIPEPTEDDAGGEYDTERGFFVTKLKFPVDALANGGENFDPEKDAEKAREEGWDWFLDEEIVDDTVILTVKTSEYNRCKRDYVDNVRENLAEDAREEDDSILEITIDDNIENMYVYVTSEDEYRSSFDGFKIWGSITAIKLVNIYFGFTSEKITLHVIDRGTMIEFLTSEY